MTMTPDLAELKRIAEAALASGPPAEDEFLDTFDPPAVVALFARIEALEAACEAVKAADALTADLLKALHALREEMVGVGQWWGDLRQAVDAADEAISRAEGRTP